MSLFHVQEWYQTHVEEGRCMTNAQLIGNREQIIIGSLNGNLVIIDPGRDVENRKEVSVLIEKQLSRAVLQILVGRFLTNYKENLLAVLHPKVLSFYRLNSTNGESYTLENIFEHRLPHGPAYNMCLGEISKQQLFQLYVQTLNCSLSIYEGENHLLDRQLLTAIHPGPIVYAPNSKCLYNASGGFLSCYPFHSFTATTGNQQKKLNSDWSFNLGDTAVDIADIDIPPIQPSILVLCKHNLFCITHGGSPRFVIRLQVVATTLLVYKTTNDPLIQLCIGTSTKTLLFYRDTRMIWSAQLEVIPVSLTLGNFGGNFIGMITVLSDECKVIIGYLGTEPSLFRMPITESRFIDFDKRRQEMEQWEQRIKQSSKENGPVVGSKMSFELTAKIEMDVASMAYDTYDNVPSATLTVKINSSAQNVYLAFQSEAFSQSQFFSLSSSEYGNISITVFVREKPVRDARFRLAATSNSGEATTCDSALPLKLLCQETSSQRSAQIKISVDSTGSPLSIADLYPDFETENQASLGLQPYNSNCVVSIFSAGKNSRYRVQSDSTEFLFLIFDDLIRRIQKRQPEARLNCPVPLHLFVSAIGEHVELEKKRISEMAEVERISVQMRHVETVLLNKLKAERDETMTPINVLINYTYRELLISMDRLRVTEEQLETHKNDVLKPLLNLMELVMRLSGINVPFDGRILDGNGQTLAQRIAPLLGGTFNQDVNAAELTRLLISFCEQGGRLSGITEAINENDEDEDEVEKSLPGQELITLESGSLSIGHNLLDLLEDN